MIGKTNSSSMGASKATEVTKTKPDSSIVGKKPPKPPKPPFIGGTAIIQSANERMERRPPENRPTIEPIKPPARASSGGGGHSSRDRTKNTPIKKAGATPIQNLDELGAQIDNQAKKAPADSQISKKKKPPRVEQETSKLPSRTNPIPRRP